MLGLRGEGEEGGRERGGGGERGRDRYITETFTKYSTAMYLSVCTHSINMSCALMRAMVSRVKHPPIKQRLETQIVTDKATGLCIHKLPGWKAFLLLLELSDNDGFDSDNWEEKGRERERERERDSCAAHVRRSMK